MKNLLLLLILLCATALHAQTDSTKKEKKIPVTFDGYVDVYFSATDNTIDHFNTVPIFYSHNRVNQVAINQALLTVHYADEKKRANLGFHAGTYSSANGPFLVAEANAGVILAKNVWLDAGILPSHIGLETAVSKDQWTLSRSFCAEYSPYYETGAKLTYEGLDHWTFSALVLNGWQNITKDENAMALGTQVLWEPNDRFVFNSSTYYGNEPDYVVFLNNQKTRFFHDFYAKLQLTDHLGLAGVFDYGIQGKRNANGYDNWMSSALFFRVTVNDKWNTCLRGEYSSDAASVQLFGTQIAAGSLNIDYSPFHNVLLRAEGRYVQAENKFWNNDNRFIQGTVSLSVGF